MIEPIDFFLLCLATWRLSSLLVNESGPFDMFLRVRKLAGIEHDDEKKPTIIHDRFFAGLLSCVWCTSIWVGAAMTAAWYAIPVITFYGCLALGLSAGAILVQELLRRIQ